MALTTLLNKKPKGTVVMTIWVHFKRNTINNTIDIFGYVKDAEELDTLIENDAVYAFKRSSGWVQIGKDQIRRKDIHQPYKGPERRASSDATPDCGLHQQSYVCQPEML